MTMRHYNWLILGSIAIFIALTLYFATTLQPLDGDLTRVGGLREKDFGWNTAQQRFPIELHSYYEMGAPFPETDVLVLGDSFSHQKGRRFGWQNFLVARTGLKLVTFDVNEIPILAILNSEAYRRRPPRIVIYQSVERLLHERLLKYPGNCRAASTTEIVRSSITVKNHEPTLESVSRPLSFGADYWHRLDSVMHFFKMKIRYLLSPSNVVILPTVKNHLFSSRKTDLLVYRMDLQKFKLDDSELQAMGCGLVNLRNLVIQNLDTHFVPLIVPDKTSIYAPYLSNPDRAYSGIINRITTVSRLDIPDLKSRLDTLVKEGQSDVYLPNNSHWGWVGHKEAADTLYQYLLDQHIITEL